MGKNECKRLKTSLKRVEYLLNRVKVQRKNLEEQKVILRRNIKIDCR